MIRKFIVALFSFFLLSSITSAASLQEIGLSKDSNSLPGWNFTYHDNEFYKVEISSLKINGILGFFSAESGISELQQIQNYAEKDFSRLLEKHPYSTITKKEEIEFNGKPLIIYSVIMRKEKDGPKLNTVNYYFLQNNQIGYLFMLGNQTTTFHELGEAGSSFFRALKYSKISSIDLLELVKKGAITSYTDSASGLHFPLPIGWQIKDSDSSGFTAITSKYPSVRIRFTSKAYSGTSFHKITVKDWENFSQYIEKRGGGSYAKYYQVAGRGAAYVADYSSGELILLTLWDEAPYSYTLMMTGNSKETALAKADFDRLLIRIQKS